MPVSRKPRVAPESATQPLTPRTPGEPAGPRLPRRIAACAVVRDESGSMSRWRQRQGEYITTVAAHLLEAGGPRVGELVYVLNCVVSGGVTTTEFAPLSAARDPAFTPDGQTPIGQALLAVAEKIEAFLEGRVFPQEVALKTLQVLVVSDLEPTGETGEQTEAGLARFLAVAKKYNAVVSVVGPGPEAMNRDLAARLDASGRGIKYLDSDPKAVLQITFESLLSASRLTLDRPGPSSLIE